MTLHTNQVAVAEFLAMLGLKADVDRRDTRLGKFLGKDDARKLRGWCGEYRGANGKQHPGHVPSNCDDVRDVFETLIGNFEASLRPALERHLAELCAKISAPSPPPTGTLAATNIDGIVHALTTPMWKHADVYLDVVTRCGAHHRTCASCMDPMLEQVAATARAGTRISVRIIELGARISVQPDTTTWPANLSALVCPAGDHERLSWYGSLVSARDRDREIPLVGMVGWRDQYCVLTPTPLDPNPERELSEKQDDFRRMWARVTATSTPREWRLKLVS